MPHFLIKKKQIKDDIITINETDDSFFHLVKSLRIKINEKVKFIDEEKNVYLSLVSKIDKKILLAKVIEKHKSNRVLKYNLCLIQSVLMNDAQNLLIANAVQSGIKEIYPVISDNVSVSSSSLKNKTEKWEKIAYENFKQCERADMVKINPVCKLKEALLNFKKENIIIYAEKNADISLFKSVQNLDISDKIAIVIGPEGGFSKSEFDYFKKENFKMVSLGELIYKAPNAVVAGVHGLVLALENMNENK
jgi:16S rRNA (uracil1498-N3)-methyltransferase